MLKPLLALAFAAFSIGFVVAHDEHDIPLKDVPAPVMKAVTSKFPSAKPKKASKEDQKHHAEYEISIDDNGAKIDVMVHDHTKDSKHKGPAVFVHHYERTILPEKLPKAVADAVRNEQPGATVKRVEEVFELFDPKDEHKPAAREKASADVDVVSYYEVTVEVGGKEMGLKYLPGGKIKPATKAEKSEKGDEHKHD